MLQAESFCPKLSHWSKQSMCFCHQEDWMSSVPATLGVGVALNVPVFGPQPSSVHRDETGSGLVKEGLKHLFEPHVCRVHQKTNITETGNDNEISTCSKVSVNSLKVKPITFPLKKLHYYNWAFPCTVGHCHSPDPAVHSALPGWDVTCRKLRFERVVLKRKSRH